MSESVDNRIPSPNELKTVQGLIYNNIFPIVKIDYNFAKLDLIEKWSQLDAEVSHLHQEGLQLRQLQQQVQSVRGRLLELETLVLAIGADGDFQRSLSKMHQIKAQVEAEKESLLQVNVAVHSCLAQQPTDAGGIILKKDVSGLYQMWERLVFKVSEKEALLEDTEKAWKEFQEQISNLKAKIDADQQIVRDRQQLRTLGLLAPKFENALDSGNAALPRINPSPKAPVVAKKSKAAPKKMAAPWTSASPAASPPKAVAPPTTKFRTSRPHHSSCSSLMFTSANNRRKGSSASR